MFTDIAGYTALMGEDESKALRILQKNRDFLKPLVEQHNGEWLKEMGDGTLSCFTSAVDAVNCALKVQQNLKDDPELTLRIGIHIGDIVFEGGDVFGDGVNVASRIEPLSAPGGVCISEKVYDDIRNKPDLESVFLGEKSLKGVERPIRVYALTGEGLSTPLTSTAKTKSSRYLPGSFGRRWWAWVGAAAVVAIGLLLYLSGVVGSGKAGYEPQYGPHSVAVLPFLNLSGNEENEYFSDGITEEILTHLSRIAGLHVTSRTSIMQYKNHDKTIRQIADELGVAAILEGSVRRAGEKVRITGQLIDARTDKHLWAANYDRQLTDIFAVQSDVALRIADALKVTFTGGQQGEIQRTPTDSIAAYDFYLKGSAYLYGIATAGPRGERWEKAVEMYENAVAIDPEFLLAYAKMVKAHMWMYWGQAGGHDRSEARLAMAKLALDEARALDPDHPETHLAAGFYYYRGYLDYETALKEFALALEHQPNNSELLEAIGYVKRRQGRWEEGVKYLRKAAELDPLNYGKCEAVTGTYMRMREWIEAERFNNRGLILSPDDPDEFSRRISIILRSTGNIEEARNALEQSRKILGPDALINWEAVLELYDRNYEKSLELLLPKEYYSGTVPWLYTALGKHERARAIYDTMIVTTKEWEIMRPDYGTPHAQRGVAYAGLGRREEAVREGKLAVEMQNVSADAWYGPESIYYLAVIYRMVGDYDAAIDQLELVLSIPSTITGPILEIDPQWDPLREHPRFQALMEQYGESE
jgi:TolB-like protein/Tfp pilus assembly protein PilF